MPTLSRWMIKTGLLYLLLAMLMSAVMLAQPLLRLPAQVGVLYPVYVHLLVVGWITQLIIGVAHWMFPKFTKEQPRGSEALGWLVYITLNAGLLLRAVGEPLHALMPQAGAGGLLALSALLQVVAGWAFIVNLWRRIRER